MVSTVMIAAPPTPVSILGTPRLAPAMRSNISCHALPSLASHETKHNLVIEAGQGAYQYVRKEEAKPSSAAGQP